MVVGVCNETWQPEFLDLFSIPDSWVLQARNSRSQAVWEEVPTLLWDQNLMYRGAAAIPLC